MQDLILAVAFVGMILSPCAFSLFRTEKHRNVEAHNGAQPTSR